MTTVYDPHSLEANRQGRLALRQTLSMLPLTLVGLLFFLLATVFLGGLAYGLITHTMQGAVIVGTIVDLGLGLLLLGLAYRTGGLVVLDMFIGRVAHVDGPAMRFSAPAGLYGSARYFSVAKHDFQIPFRGAWLRLPDGGTVRAYYTLRSNTLVNVEPSPAGRG